MPRHHRPAQDPCTWHSDMRNNLPLPSTDTDKDWKPTDPPRPGDDDLPPSDWTGDVSDLPPDDDEALTAVPQADRLHHAH